MRKGSFVVPDAKHIWNAPMLKVAAIQMDVRLGDVARNLGRIRERMREVAAAGVRLAVFPESALAGYCFESLDEAMPFSQQRAGPELTELESLAKSLELLAVVGFLEQDGAQLYNSAAMLGGSGGPAVYRKIHLPHLGIDRFTTPGDQPVTVDAGDVRIGLTVCYDCSFPELSRVLMLDGADVIAIPTNWPPTSGRTADVIPPARALENNVYVIAANRVGEERGYRFIGKSRICDPRGATLAIADHENEEVLYAEIDPALARQKHLVQIPGKHEVNRLRDRRPEVYQPVVEPIS